MGPSVASVHDRSWGGSSGGESLPGWCVRDVEKGAGDSHRGVGGVVGLLMMRGTLVPSARLQEVSSVE